ncbi:MAG: CpaF family protein [Actinomycetia bacterium]|nr:CpaF family protein [Actinomycetes bacterium]
MESAMALIDRLVDTILLSDFPTDRVALTQHVRRTVATEAPLAPPGIVQKVVDSLIGLGPLEELLRDPDITDVLVNSPTEVWVERSGRLQRTDISFGTDQAVTAAVERVIAPLGLRIDRASPMVDARLADGSRLHAIIPPAAVDHPIVAVRRFVPQAEDLEVLVRLGSVTSDQADELRSVVKTRRNVLVSGGTGAGKTTLLNVLSALIDDTERVVVVEDASELRLRGHVVRLEGRPANSEGIGAITLQQLIRSALRLRPDRIVVGEVRGPEALDLVNALNTGHSGSMSTLHANSPGEALWRLETLALMGARNIPAEAIRAQIRSAIDVVIQVERTEGIRRVATIEHRQGQL